MRKNLTYVGLDVHKETIVVAVARGRGAAQVVECLPHDFQRLLKTLDRCGARDRLRVSYEAGPTGYGLARRLRGLGIACEVIAPSLAPVKRGQKIKTDRRDAARLAKSHASGDLTSVAIPDEADEAMRDLSRARDDAKRAERVARQQLDKFLLRHSRMWSEGTKWTLKHLRWIQQQTFEHEAQRRVLADHLLTVERASQRVAQLEKDMAELVETWSRRPLVYALQALRGVQLVSAVVLAAEIGDYSRFASPRQLMSYLGLVPSEDSSGQRRRQGSITKAGNKHVRRILTEAAWCYRFRPRPGRSILQRRTRVSVAVRAIAEKAEQRLSRRLQRLVSRGKLGTVAVTAVARELAGFVWAIAQEPELLAP